MAKYVKSQGLNVVHANTAWAGFVLTLYHDVKAHRLVYTCHNGLWPENKVHFGERVVRLIEGRTMRISSLTIALNKTMYRAIVEKARVKANKMAIIPNGVDADFFRPRLKDEDLLNERGLEEQEYILFVGRLSPEKGVHLLLKALKQIIEKIPHSMKLVIVGPFAGSFALKNASSYADAMRKYAEDELREKVVFNGSMDKNVLRVLYSNAYRVVLPSLIEAFPMVILEAMASGAPPIGSTAGGIPDIVIDGVNGLLFRRGDWRDLADKILTLIEDKALRNRLAINARKTIEKNYSWRVIALTIKKAYMRVIT
jgi:glycosyltransferase involved in cell wall biosynthesis